MKRLLIAAGVAGLSLSAAVGEASDLFRIRYRVQYSGGAYLGYPSTTKYSVSYYPQVGAGQAGAVATTQVDANGQPVYPRYLGNGYTVNGYPGPYTSYGYNYSQKFHYNYYENQERWNSGGRGGCNGCNGGAGGSIGTNTRTPSTMTIENRLGSGGQVSRQVYPGMPVRSGYQGAPVEGYPVDGVPVESYPVQGAPAPAAPPSEGVTVPPPAAPAAKGAAPTAVPVSPKTARGTTAGVPVLVSEEQEIGR